MRADRRAAGFTLLEVLVSLVVLALIILGLSQGLRFGILAFQHQAATIDRAANLDAVDRTLRALVEQIDAGNQHDAPEIAGTPRSVEFTSELPEAEIRILVDPAHRLLLRWAPYRHAKPAGPPPMPVDTVLLTQVDHVTISYWARSGPPHWLATWSGAETPALIRISLVFQPGTGMTWPAIVAAPLRSRP
jgi:general secretion pathway protein J